MKTPLCYQTSEFDCGPTSLMNALSFLFSREEIPPLPIRQIWSTCLDSFDEKGRFGWHGTSKAAMRYLSEWLNRYRETHDFPIDCEYLTGSDVFLSAQSRLGVCLRKKGAVVVRLQLEVWHYVLLTGMRDGDAFLFDPYYTEEPFEDPAIRIVSDRPMQMNRIVPCRILNGEGKGYYELGGLEEREAVLFDLLPGTKRSAE